MFSNRVLTELTALCERRGIQEIARGNWIRLFRSCDGGRMLGEQTVPITLPPVKSGAVFQNPPVESEPRRYPKRSGPGATRESHYMNAPRRTYSRVDNYRRYAGKLAVIATAFAIMTMVTAGAQQIATLPEQTIDAGIPKPQFNFWIPGEREKYTRWLQGLPTAMPPPGFPDWSQWSGRFPEFYRRPSTEEIPAEIRGALATIEFDLGHHTIARPFDAYDFRLRGANPSDWDAYWNNRWRVRGGDYDRFNQILQTLGYYHPGFLIEPKAPGVPPEINTERWIRRGADPRSTDSFLFLHKAMGYPPTIQWRRAPRLGWDYEGHSPEFQQVLQQNEKEFQDEVGRIRQGDPERKGYRRLEDVMKQFHEQFSRPQY